MATQTKIHVSTDSPTEFEPFPLGPGDLLDGDFKGQVHWLRQAGAGDGQLMTGIFIGERSTFRYVFAGDETFHVLKGRVTIELDGGESVTLTVGDIASFPKGESSVWTIHEAIKKFFVISG